jgi:hypothetical protein
MKSLTYQTISLGCDPEFFFTKSGKVCGAEKILDENGMVYEPGSIKGKRDGNHTVVGNIKSKFIVDGVQAELNPTPNTCRANLGNEISCCFRRLYEQLSDQKDLSVDFSSVVKVSKKEFDSLSEKSKVFGCAPSYNAYSKTENKIKVNPAKYKFRSAGGHLHLGHNGYPSVKRAFSQPERIVSLLDILVGNTCVLIDRDPYAKKRRKIYGRAGDYRTPPHGIEYRTLSNFWLTSYQLFSFVTGMARFAVCIGANEDGQNELEKEIVGKVKPRKIAQAINNNDFDLAMENFSKIEKTVINIAGDYSNYPLNKNTISEFHHFITKPLSYWFPTHPLDHWIHLPEGHGTGWESFCLDKVQKDRKNDESIKKSILSYTLG